jgi:Integrase core domain
MSAPRSRYASPPEGVSGQVQQVSAGVHPSAAGGFAARSRENAACSQLCLRLAEFSRPARRACALHRLADFPHAKPWMLRYQNALAERVNGILKGEFLLTRPADRSQARRMVAESIQIYNHERPHLSLKMQAPDAVHRVSMVG